MLYDEISNRISETARQPENADQGRSAVVRELCYIALENIKAVLADDSLDDEHCFTKIERIVQIYEALGSDGGCRHDFG